MGRAARELAEVVAETRELDRVEAAAFEEFLPAVLEAVRRSQELTPLVQGAISRLLAGEDGKPRVLSEEDAKSLKALVPLLNAQAAADERLLRWVWGKPVERSVSKSEVSVDARVRHEHVSLGELLGRRRGGGVGEVVVDAEVVE